MEFIQELRCQKENLLDTPDTKDLQGEIKSLGYDVADDGKFGKQTEKAAAKFQRYHQLWGTGVYDRTTARFLNQAIDNKCRTIEGQVRQPNDGAPLAQMIVKAYDKDLRSEEFVGRGVTNHQGHYKIEYAIGQLRKGDTTAATSTRQRRKLSADLIIRVYNWDDVLLGESDGIRFNASINRVLTTSISEP